MPPTDGFLKRTLPDLSKSRQHKPSTASNTYGTVNLSENSSAVIGNVVHQHFYTAQPSVHSPVGADEDGGSRSVELRNNLSKVQVEAISDYDHQYAHWLRSQRRVPDTCNWIMKVAKFKDWVTGVGPPVLVCVGSVGCGKSINTSAVVDWLSKPIVGTKPPVISYYVEAVRPHPTTTSEILHAFVKQIVGHCRESNTFMPRDLHDKVEAICTPLTSATTSIVNLTAIIQHFLRLQPLCFFVVDGIDSLLEPEILTFITFLKHIWDPQLTLVSQNKLMLSCRETLGRRIRLESVPSSAVLQVGLKHLEPDIHLYVNNEVDTRQTENPITNDDVLVEEIKSVLKSNSEKMFLWIYLQILSLWDPGLTTCDSDIRDQLKSLPEGLDEVYLRCLRRIDATNDKRSREIAPRMFEWLASAQVALTPTQAREAVSLTPDNLPLQRSQLLMSPVTDYCANLVVVDDLTGTVKFPHPSVKDFLSDSKKIPSELGYLSLSNTERDYWCGRICLTHAKLHHAREQLVAFRSQEIEPKITKPILNKMFENVLPFKLRSRYTLFEDPPYRMALTAVPARQASPVADLSLHGYIRQHWLAHNNSISEDLPHYVDFVDLCLVHDSDLQPWSTSPATNIEHYRRMVMHAVMTNHAPLLGVARYAVEARGQNYWQGVFQKYAPGTDSTYLHCAAALGHIDVLRILLLIYSGNVADAQGTSAASAAIQVQQMEAFKLLIPKRADKGFSWQLKDLELEKPARQRLSARTLLTERLLDRCATCGNLKAIEILLEILATQRIVINRAGLDSAFFLACKNGYQDIAKSLVAAGADPKCFIWSDNPGLENIGIAKGDKSPAFLLVLESGNLKMMKTLLAVRQAVGVKIDDVDLLQVVQHFDGGHQNPDPCLRLLLKFGGANEEPDRSSWELLSWLNCLPLASLGQTPPSRTVSRFIRLILRSPHAGPHSITALKAYNRIPGSIECARFAAWLAWATDDVLVHAVRLGWVELSSLLSPFCLNAALSRNSSRLMELIIDLLQAGDEDDILSSFKSRLSQMQIDGVEAITTPRTQILEFLICEDLVLWWTLIRSWTGISIAIGEYGYVATIAEATKAYERFSAHPLYPCLMWVRCYLKTKGNVAATRTLCGELQRIGASGNFALNFPAGYSYVYGRETSTKTWVISQRIWLAVHRWNFRRNRARGRLYSECDMWYMATVLKKFVDQRFS